tara:strand:+ start:107 stop:499 length:393 start_codon:yes stop_codon:yes gene_type:complete
MTIINEHNAFDPTDELQCEDFYPDSHIARDLFGPDPDEEENEDGWHEDLDLYDPDFLPDPDDDRDRQYETDFDPDEDPWSDDTDWEELERDPYEDGVSGEPTFNLFDSDGGLTAEALAFLADEDANGRFI